MNLNVRLDELSSWANLPTIRAGFGWTGRNARRESADRFVNVREDTEYTGFRVGLGQPEWEWNSFTEGGYGSDAGAPAWDYESGPKNWKRDQEGYNDRRFLDDPLPLRGGPGRHTEGESRGPEAPLATCGGVRWPGRGALPHVQGRIQLRADPLGYAPRGLRRHQAQPGELLGPARKVHRHGPLSGLAERAPDPRRFFLHRELAQERLGPGRNCAPRLRRAGPEGPARGGAHRCGNAGNTTPSCSTWFTTPT